MRPDLIDYMRQLLQLAKCPQEVILWVQHDLGARHRIASRVAVRKLFDHHAAGDQSTSRRGLSPAAGAGRTTRHTAAHGQCCESTRISPNAPAFQIGQYFHPGAQEVDANQQLAIRSDRCWFLNQFRATIGSRR